MVLTGFKTFDTFFTFFLRLKFADSNGLALLHSVPIAKTSMFLCQKCQHLSALHYYDYCQHFEM